MTTIITNIYSYNELSDDAKETAIQSLMDQAQNDPYILDHTSDQCMVSLRAIADDFGVKLTDWSIGAHNYHNYVKTSSVLRGNRAKKAVAEVLIRNGYPRRNTFAEMEDPSCFPGRCPWTGVCFDESLIEEIAKAVMTDDLSLNEAFDRAGDKIASILELEWDYLTSEDHVRSHLDPHEDQFNEDGTLIIS